MICKVFGYEDVISIDDASVGKIFVIKVKNDKSNDINQIKAFNELPSF